MPITAVQVVIHLALTTVALALLVEVTLMMEELFIQFSNKF